MGVPPLTEPFRFQPVLKVLHGLRCIGVAGDDRLARATDVPREKVAELLNRLQHRGLVELDPGPFGGWSLTSGGRVTVDELTRAELEETGARDGVYRCYRTFLGLNHRILKIADDWQMRRVGRTHVRNDHKDPDYDAAVLSRLIDIDETAQQVCAELTELLARFGVYGRRLSFALERALAGDTGYVADSVDSYHAVWFQLHEDLLSTLGIPRDWEARRA